MSNVAFRRRHQYRRWSWVAGILVLGGLAWTLSTLVETQSVRRVTASMPEVQQPGGNQPTPAGGANVQAATPVARRIEGIVKLPSGAPANGVTVVVYRALTTGPEWRREAVDRAITGADGAFVFGLPERHGLLVGFSHNAFAGDLVEVPELRDRLELQLHPGFQLTGVVTNDVGKTLGGVRVAAESTIDQQRRVVVDITTADGRYQFDNLPAGLIRLVARHERWQAIATTVRVGETRQNNIRFRNAASAPLRGRVVDTGQVPIAGAAVELVPTNGRLGLVDPIMAQTDAQGAFVLAGLSRGPMSLRVRHPGFGILRRTVSAGASPTEHLLELPPRSEVTGALIAADSGLAVAGVTLRIVDTAREIQHVETDAEGRFAFLRPLSAGLATVAALGGRFAFLRSQSFEMSVQVDERQQTDLQLEIAAPTVVRGRCIDDAGRALAGVAVYGSTQLTVAKLIGSNLASFMGSVGEEVALTIGGDRAALLAVTGADGAFEFTAQEPGPLLTRYELPGRARRRLRVVVPVAGTVGVVEDIVMPRGCRIEGIVKRGVRPLAGVVVAVTGHETQVDVLTRSGGRFDVPDLLAGTYRVRARLPSMPTGQAQKNVSVALDQRPPQVTLDLPPGRVVRGVVTRFGGQPVANALVSVRGSGGQPTLTDADGSFSLELPSDRITLQISLGDEGHTQTQMVQPFEQDLTIRFDAPPTCTLVARVAGLPGRKRIAAVLMRWQRQAGDEASVERPRWIEVQNGELRWPLCPVGRCRIEIRCEGYVPFRVNRELLAQEEHDLGDVLLEPGASVRGTVRDDAGKPVANARVMLGEEADIDLFEPQLRSAVDGSFLVHGVSSRSSKVVAHAPGFAPGVRQLSLPQDVFGDVPIELTLRAGSLIRVIVDDPPEAGLVQLLRDGRLLATAVLDDTGEAVFVDRSPGDYQVRLYGSEHPAQDAKINRPGQSVDVTIQ